MLWIMINSNILVLSYQPKKNFARGHINKRETLQTGREKMKWGNYQGAKIKGRGS